MLTWRRSRIDDCHKNDRHEELTASSPDGPYIVQVYDKGDIWWRIPCDPDGEFREADSLDSAVTQAQDHHEHFGGYSLPTTSAGSLGACLAMATKRRGKDWRQHTKLMTALAPHSRRPAMTDHQGPVFPDKPRTGALDWPMIITAHLDVPPKSKGEITGTFVDHGPPDEDERYYIRADQVQEMIAAEREACAMVAEEYAAWHTPPENEYQSAQHDSGKFIATAIRARG